MKPEAMPAYLRTMADAYRKARTPVNDPSCEGDADRRRIVGPENAAKFERIADHIEAMQWHGR